MKIILGSSSPFRRAVLEKAGIPFEVVRPDIDEKKIRTLEHEHTPIVLSYAKGAAVAQKVPDPAIVIACDQVAICDGIILEKPESADDVRRWYKLYAQYPVQYINGITVLNTETGACITGQEIALVSFKTIPDDFTEQQIRESIVFECCGALTDALEDAYGTILKGTKESTIGLPLRFIMDMVEKVK